MPKERGQKKAPSLDPEALSLQNAEVTALHSSVRLSGPQPTGSPRFSPEKLTALYSEVSKYGFDSFSLLPIGGAQMATMPSRQAIIALDRTTMAEKFAISGSSLRSFAELAAMLLDGVRSHLDVEGYRALLAKLVAFWPIGGEDAVNFVARAVRMSQGLTLRLGSDFYVAGVRFHKGQRGEQEELDVRVEPLLAQRDHLWLEVTLNRSKPLAAGSELLTELDRLDRFMRQQVRDTVLAMAGDKGGGT